MGDTTCAWLGPYCTRACMCVCVCVCVQTMSTYMPGGSVLPGEGTPEESAQFLLNLVSYITENGFRLIDFDGNVTTWGNWYGVCVCLLFIAVS